ncbi:hypothetical protein [Flavivirga spongiicola]|uniref:Lipocalin-like domain-containing protein n=1 Tax=Flavivirga spongiicola TaxID=421621 RepID=A0ABU7XS30_9FLAO|nr:hypothetical protein [Flavivirga sp. MEBiC05379]MDO5978563.1 hypothetical protein [Flavivirga sp. MEBiC05379]
MRIFYFLILFSLCFFTSCENKQAIEGLWVVKSVIVGEEKITPNGRWMRFNSDFTQQSGNGWFQHSIGTWSLNPKTNELSILNSNGLNDLNEPFKVMINKNEMTWKRMEEGDSIKVSLIRSYKLPETYGDNLLGLWKLEEAIGEGNYFTQSGNTNTVEYLFFRWDKRFVIGSEKGRINGVYNVHGHKPEVELIPYGDQLKRDFWKVDSNKNSMTLKLLNTDSIVTRTFKRIHDFPQ